MSVWTFIWLGGPFMVGLVLTALIRLHWSKNGPWVADMGLALAVAYVVAAYYHSPPSSAPYNGCSDCENYLGLFWEPQFEVSLAVVGYCLWLVGVGTGIGAIAALNAGRRALGKLAS